LPDLPRPLPWRLRELLNAVKRALEIRSLDQPDGRGSVAGGPAQQQDRDKIVCRPTKVVNCRKLQVVSANSVWRQTVAQHDGVLRMRHKRCANSSLRGQVAGEDYFRDCRKTGDDNGVLPPRGFVSLIPGYGCVAPAASHAAIFARSSSVMPVRLPIGIALVATTCS
jgi:hypothetical protein